MSQWEPQLHPGPAWAATRCSAPGVNLCSYLEPGALRQGRPSGSLRSIRPCSSIPDAGRRRRPTPCFGAAKMMSTEHPEQQHSHKRNRNQESVQTGFENAVVHDRLMFS